MKAVNIVFSGLMIVVLSGIGIANAADIASTDYVDRKDTETLTTIQNTYATQSSVDLIEQNVSNLDTTINDETDGLKVKVENAVNVAGQAQEDVGQLKTDVSALKTTVGDDTSGLVKDVTDLKNSVDDKLDYVTAAQTYEVLNNKTQNLAADAESQDKYPSAKAVTDAIKTATEGIESSSAINDLQNKVGDGVLTTSATDLTGAVNELNSALDEKQNKNIPNAQNHIVVTDETGNITTTEKISSEKIDNLAPVATSGEYSDLTGRPIIPTTVEELTDSGNYVTTTKLNEDLATKQNVLGYTPENTNNKKTEITDDIKDSEVFFPTVGAITQWTNTEIQRIRDEGIDIGSDNIGEGAIATKNIANGAVTTEKIANGAVTEVKLSSDLADKINGKEDVINKAEVIDSTNVDSVDEYTSVKAVVNYVIPKPDDSCTAASNLCVLSVTKDGNYAWVNVTAPVQY